jgi:hypothetical protein
MKLDTPKVLIVSTPPDFGEKRYQAAKLEGDTYAFVTGNISVRRLHPLPIEPGDAGKIDRPLDMPSLRTRWHYCLERFEASGDHEPAKQMRDAWLAFEREALSGPPPRRPHEIN